MAPIRYAAGDCGHQADYSEVRLKHGVFWLSRQSLLSPIWYEAETPDGLHVGCGLASMSTVVQGIGAFGFDGAGMITMNYTGGPARVATTLSSGETYACVLYLPHEPHDDDGPFAELRKAAGDEVLIRVMADRNAALIARLVSPIDGMFQGAARRLALEARALELAALIVSWFDGKARLETSSTRRDATIYATARDLLDSRLTDPPTLAALARETGVSVRSLTAAFRRCSGISIGGYVTERRLEIGRPRLAEGASVSEAAYAAGYLPSHFSAAFKRRYGIAPSRFRAR